MAFSGLAKNINKANQLMKEKIGSAQGTMFDEDFVEMERKVDIYYEMTAELEEKTKEYLQPNAETRAKMSAAKGIYPQPHGVLGECMVEYGKQLDEDGIYAQALVETGESMKQVADIKYTLDDNINMNFVDPLHQLSKKDLKEVMHHRKKLHSRRLDFDSKKRKRDKGGSNVTDEEFKLAEDKFAESWHLAQMGMNNLLENDVEKVTQLVVFAESNLEYHKQCGEILEALVKKLQDKKNVAAMDTKNKFVPKTLSDLGILSTVNGGLPSNRSASPIPSSMNNSARRLSVNEGLSSTKWASTIPSPRNKPTRPQSVNEGLSSNRSTTPIPSPRNNSSQSRSQPSAIALHDFEVENPGELGFNEGDIIKLTQKIDGNWLEGSCNGKTGLFPCTYVKVTVPLPN
ncbi:unnamed protein product [Meganyctiphanes norvegica]|uniref:Endophilin-A n=1 Tax=Meganyctiphanes norvegica TaxID=48144 RepID=A0AAV2S757_MEGNR